MPSFAQRQNMKKVIIDLEKLKDFESGLGQFCFHLYQNLSNNDQYNFIIKKQSVDFFNPSEKVHFLNYLYRFSFGLPEANVWHSTHQDSHYYPFNTGSKVILTIHDLNYIHQRIDKKNKVKKYLKRLQQKIDRADIITFISNFTRDDVVKHLNIESKKTYVIPNGVALSDVRPKKIMLPTNKKFFFSLGKFHSKKNLHLLIKMMAFLDDYSLILAGDNNNSYGNQITGLIDEHQLNERVFTIGKVSESQKKWLYQNCELFLMPSSHEGFGLPVIESHFLGTPTIVSNLSALPETAGPDSFYFSELSPKTMSQDIKKALSFLKTNSLGEKLKLNASKYSWKKTVENYEKIYQEA